MAGSRPAGLGSKTLATRERPYIGQARRKRLSTPQPKIRMRRAACWMAACVEWVGVHARPDPWSGRPRPLCPHRHRGRARMVGSGPRRSAHGPVAHLAARFARRCADGPGPAAEASHAPLGIPDCAAGSPEQRIWLRTAARRQAAQDSRSGGWAPARAAVRVRSSGGEVMDGWVSGRPDHGPAQRRKGVIVTTAGGARHVDEYGSRPRRAVQDVGSAHCPATVMEVIAHDLWGAQPRPSFARCVRNRLHTADCADAESVAQPSA